MLPIKVIVCVDEELGIGVVKNNLYSENMKSEKSEKSLDTFVSGITPWPASACSGDMKYFAKTTKYTVNANAQNALIFGKTTYESIPEKNRPLAGRINIIISRTFKSNKPDEYVFSTFDEAINFCLLNKVTNVTNGTNNKHEQSTALSKPIETIFACGGHQIYKEALCHPLCTHILMNTAKGKYNCNVFFPLIDKNQYEYSALLNDPEIGIATKLYRRRNKAELAYLDLLQRILNQPLHPNRTGIDTKSLFAETLKYPLCDQMGRMLMPLLTTKQIFFRGVLVELLWFIMGSTNTKFLKENKVKIWDPNSTREFLDSRELQHYKEGQLGPVYGAQWRHFGGDYDPIADKMKDGTDQLTGVIQGLKKDPFGRRHVVSAWNPCDLNKMALPPCHLMFIFNVEYGDNELTSKNIKYLNCHLIMRSNDEFLGHPFNVASYALLTHMIAYICGYTAKTLAITMTDAHLYANQIEQSMEQINRIPRGFPFIEFSQEIHDLKSEDKLTIDDFKLDSISLRNYYPLSAIVAKMAV